MKGIEILRRQKGTWIIFEQLKPPEELNYKPKTQRWVVLTKRDYLDLGTIKWANGWRTYAFYPSPKSYFENKCLKEIANFIIQLMKEKTPTRR